MSHQSLDVLFIVRHLHSSFRLLSGLDLSVGSFTNTLPEGLCADMKLAVFSVFGRPPHDVRLSPAENECLAPGAASSHDGALR